MPLDEHLVQRVRTALKSRTSLSERRMFGGVAFMVNGNMACGIVRDRLMLRLGNEEAALALKEPFTQQMDFTGKPMKSMIYALSDGIQSDEALNGWLERALAFARQLPSQAKKKKKSRPSAQRRP